jgi:sialic acid synthase SpsE
LNTLTEHHTFGDQISSVNAIPVEGRRIGENEPTFIIAEAACNHLCRMDLAIEMIDKACDAGADAIKFQTYKAEKLVTNTAVAFWGDEKISQLEYYKRLDRFGKKEYDELFNYARERGIIGFSSPFDAESVDMLAEISMPVFKIASCEIPNLKFLEYVAKQGKPIILSTGASTIDEINRAIETIFEQGNQQLMLMACTLSYPTKNENANLLRVRTLREHYSDFIIGVSDHTEPDPYMVIPSVAVALGAKIIEKHYTLDRSMTGSGHFFAMDPADLKRMVQNVRLTEQVLGDGSLGVAKSEEKAWSSARRSIVADVAIKKGDILSSEMISLKRPADGLTPDMIDQIIGKRVKHDVKADQKITLEMFE